MKAPIYLVINADDLGRSPSINSAIEYAHRLGILNSASMMAGGEAFGEAVELAKRNPGLSIGLHITLCDGRSVLPHSEIPGLTKKDKNGFFGFFEKSPAKAGLKYWTQRKTLTGQIEAEIEAQFDRLIAAGITPAHVDSHHHLHAHPVIFKALCGAAMKRGVKWMRMPPGPFGEFLNTARGIHFSKIQKIPEWMVFKALEFYNGGAARNMGFQFAQTYGLSHTGRICENYLMRLIPSVKGPVAEIFLHPDLSTQEGKREMEAVMSEKVKKLAGSCGVALAGFEDVKMASERNRR